MVQSSNVKLVGIFDFEFNSKFIRFGLTRAKVLQTVSRFPRETRCRYAAPKSNAVPLFAERNFIEIKIENMTKFKEENSYE
jgi:hypothetical protein